MGVFMEINRDVYLNRLIVRKHNGFIKVITGIRRCIYRNLVRKLHPTTVGCEMNCTGWLFASLFVFSGFNVLTFVFISSLAFNVFLNFFHNCCSCCCYKVAVTPERSISPQIFLYFFRVIRPHLF